MDKYTGAYAKHKALILLAENPADITSWDVINPNPELGEFTLMLALRNMSLTLRAPLPLSDLSLVTASLDNNAELRQAFDHWKTSAFAADREFRRKDEQRSSAIAATYSPNSGLTPEQRCVRGQEIDAEFNAFVEQQRVASRQDFAAAQPALAARSGDLRAYLADVDRHATKAAGITEADEAKLLAPSDDWLSEWGDFIAAQGFRLNALRLAYAFKQRSSDRCLMTMNSVMRDQTLRQIGPVVALMTPDQLERTIAFSNQMAAKRAPFIGQTATFGDLIDIAGSAQFAYQGNFLQACVNSINSRDMAALADDLVALGYEPGDTAMIGQFLDHRFPNSGVRAAINPYGPVADVINAVMLHADASYRVASRETAAPTT